MAEREELTAEEESEINLTPMLDVVFIMLIFFIVTAVFVKDPGVEVARPESVMALTAEGGSIFVAITAENTVHIDQNEVDISEVRFNIERLRNESPEAGVVVQADSGARNEVLIQVLDAAKAAGAENIMIAAGEN